MTAIDCTPHARLRMRQRGVRDDDLAFILSCATSVDGETLILRNRDVQREVEARKREIRILERLKGQLLVIRNGRAVTTYKPQPAVIKRKLRRQ